MFKELTPILKKGDTLVLHLTRESDTEFRVNITPKLFTMDGQQGDDRRALAQPVTVKGTVEELDSPEFAATLDRFRVSVTGLRQTIEDVEAAHKHAKESKLKAPPKPASKAKPADTEEDAEKSGEEDGDEADETPAAPPAPKKNEPVLPDLI